MSQQFKSLSQRFKVGREISDTLQGHVYIGYDKQNNNKQIILKEAWKKLVKNSMSRSGHNVKENILNEREIQKYLSSLNDCDDSITKCIAIWDDDTSYWIALEKCDNELLNFIQKSFDDGNECDKLVKLSKNKQQICLKKPNKWVQNIKIIFKQMVNGTNYMHSKSVCHMDISLENTMINVNKNGDIQAKIIDFGLSKMFINDDFICNKPVGKISYMSPETYNRDKYDARANDIYCLGVCLFMMLIGAPPYGTPDKSDIVFKYIIEDNLQYILTKWKRMPLITKNALDLLTKMLCYEKDRIKMKDLLKHPFLNTDIKYDKNIIGSDIDEEKEETKYDEKYDDDNDDLMNTDNNIELLGGLDSDTDIKSLAGLDNDEDITNNNNNNDDDMLNMIKQREQMILNSMNVQINNTESNNNVTNNQPMRRLARIKLQDWNMIKYENNFVKYGYTKLSHFEDLNENILINQVGLSKNDAIMFVKKFNQYKGF